jgi:hypothetical protein
MNRVCSRAVTYYLPIPVVVFIDVLELELTCMQTYTT